MPVTMETATTTTTARSGQPVLPATGSNSSTPTGRGSPAEADGRNNHTLSADHNFDTLRAPPEVRTSGQPDVNMDPDIMTSGYKSTSNRYLRAYQEKYGKLGIFRDQGDSLASEASRTLCFPFFKENSRKTPGGGSGGVRKSYMGLGDRPGSPREARSVSTSWDPSMIDSKYSPLSSPLSSSPIGTGHGFRSIAEGDLTTSNIGHSAGRDWHCSVFESPELKQQHAKSMSDLTTSSPYAADQHILQGDVQQHLSDSVEDKSTGENLMKLSKSNVTVLAQTALRELEASYKRPTNYSDDSDIHSVGSKGSGGSCKSDHNRTSSPLRELTSLVNLSRGDFQQDGLSLCSPRVDSSVPVINVSQDYELNNKTVPKRTGSRTRSSRRAVSDLGFRNKEPGIVPTPRTAALLSSPAFKKHLAKNMGISEEDLNEKDFQYDFKLSLPTTSSNTSPTKTRLSPDKSEVEVSPGSKLGTMGLRERLLRTSVSDSSLHHPPPSCLNLSFGALSQLDSSFSNSLDQTVVSEPGQNEPSVLNEKDMITSSSSLSALNTGFNASSASLSELPLSPIAADLSTSPSGGKVKFHIPSFREFKQQRTSKRTLTPRSPASSLEHFNFDFISKNAIQEEENESEHSSVVCEKPKELVVDSHHTKLVSVDDNEIDAEALVNALSSDLIETAILDDEVLEAPDEFIDKTVLVYDPSQDAATTDTEKLEPPEAFSSKHRDTSERKSKRSHKSRSSKSSSNSSGSVNNDNNSEGLTKACHDIVDSQDSRGKHRKEPNRRSMRSSCSKIESQTEGQSLPQSENHIESKDSVLDGRQEVKLIKEFKIRDSSRGDSSHSKIMVVMVKDEVKDVADTQRVKDTGAHKVTERPPKPERRKRKEDAKKNETYVVEESPTVRIEQYDLAESRDSSLKRDGSKSRSSKRSSSRSKRSSREDSLGREKSENKGKEFDERVVGGHPGDGFESKQRSDHFRRSSRRSSRRRFLPKSNHVEETTPTDLPTVPIVKVDEDHTNKPDDEHVQQQQLSAESSPTAVVRSVSDISDKKAEEQRKKGVKERRHKLYKSDPFQGPSTSAGHVQQATHNASGAVGLTKSDLVGSQMTRDEILTLIEDRKSAPGRATSSSVQSLDSFYGDESSEEGPSSAEVERVDSGVGAELKDSSSSKEFKGGPICEDCEDDLTSENMSSDSDFLCKKCESRRIERKETIQEIVDTEVSYGKDLKIIKEEFYTPMQTAGLLNDEQLSTVFSNLEELITINERFSDQLQDGLELANEQGDEDYNSVHIGWMFLEASNMLLAFETYCVNQASVPTLLEKLEEEKELLRIFLHVSQTENSLLRRMNLKSFLMVPVQRVMKYPLLLSRLYKATSVHHEDREAIKRAQGRVEDILEHINSQSRGGNNATMRLRRKISGLSVIKKTGSADDIEINKMAIEVLGWNRKDVNFVMCGRLMFTQPTDTLWMKKGRTLKFMPAYALLLTLGRSSGERWTGRLLFSRSTGIQDAALVLIKEKAGKFVPLRDPLKLERCVISVDPEFDEVFEIMDSNKESFLFKGEDKKDTLTWIRHLKLQTKDLGAWRRRRNALPNIMIHSTKT